MPVDAVEFWDDISGAPLKPQLVKAARAEEMKMFSKCEVYDKVSEDECWKETGKGPIGTRWVDINKGDDSKLEYRSRLVAQEIKKDKSKDLFAATPPLEAKKVLLSLFASTAVGTSGAPLALDFVDVCRAYFRADAIRAVYVKLPREDEPDNRGRLHRAMPGTRDALGT